MTLQSRGLSFDTRFDPAEFAFESADDRLAGGGPFLESSGGMQIGFRARVRPEDPTRVQVSATLVATDRAQAPDGGGVLAVLTFRSLGGSGTLTPVDVVFLDSDGEEDAITRLGGATVGSASPDSLQLAGDCSQDGSVDISDAVCALGVLFLGNPEFFPCGDGTSGDPANVTLLGSKQFFNRLIRHVVRKLTSAPYNESGTAHTPRLFPVWTMIKAIFRRKENGSVPAAPVAIALTRSARTLSRDALERRLAKHVATAARGCPSLREKRITLHVLRHTAAMRLLQAGVDTSIIALWLGHEQVETTQVYLHADFALKERALARTTPTNTKPGRYRPPDPILAFLEAL